MTLIVIVLKRAGVFVVVFPIKVEIRKVEGMLMVGLVRVIKIAHGMQSQARPNRKNDQGREYKSQIFLAGRLHLFAGLTPS